MQIDSNIQFSQLDIAFSRFLGERTCLQQQQKIEFEKLCARLSNQQSEGHSCLLVNESEQLLLQTSGLLLDKNNSALIMEDNRLYLQRYWYYENRLAIQIKNLLTQTVFVEGLDLLISRYFIDLIDEIDYQREAVKKAVAQSFCMITGGPGTGKTSTVVKMLAILQELSEYPLHIALAAPTGKAAMRLQQSLIQNKNSLPCSEGIKKQIPETVSTLHYLLGAQRNSPFFKHNSQLPLAYDLVVVDESSMVDLALMSKLVDALKPEARLILLGDKDQLSSVESGAILADLTASLPKHSYELKKSYRFQGEIKALADAVNMQSVDKAWNLLERGGNNIGLLKTEIIKCMVDGYDNYLKCVNNKAELTEIFDVFNHFQVLCSNRKGERGVVSINDRFEKQLLKENKVWLSGQWYIGRPVIVMENSPGVSLYNGDVGICLWDQETNKLAVFFLPADGSIKKVSIGRMPANETVFAMTIHKSQGSEFNECLCVLADKMNPVLSKELLYTAITRAKQKLRMICEYSIFSQAVQQKVARNSGLCEKLIAENAE
ncbi:MAG: exodeoxyribonuclease V subunit alpha [Methylococcales symbiont of Iophon sp. n. MRB-2018]|nr:MAG: exodeoxyribonuclease V subunit alpha [Methylococcales symbiont of Iophon sp. n. MRB-2018]KAF3978884.1 MAG: exodeoxyribonuclease V subunit alpha [Methylococcales symbiont of Iophon sp. n. MRB-2018]